MTGGEWRTLIEAFVAGDIDGLTFERRFLDGWRWERDNGVRNAYAIDQLFYEVDAFCTDPTLIGPNDIDEAGLRAAARKALETFDTPWPPRANDPQSVSDQALLDNFRRAAKKLGLVRT